MVNFCPVGAEIVSLVWGTPAISTAFASWQRYCKVLQPWASAKLCGVEQRAPPIFGRVAITLGIGPHFSSVIISHHFMCDKKVWCGFVPPCTRSWLRHCTTMPRCITNRKHTDSVHAKYSASHHTAIKPFLLLGLAAEYRSRRWM